MTLEELVSECFPELIERDDGEVYVNCPFCEERGETSDTRRRLGINYENGTWNCFNCSAAGRDNPERLFYDIVRVFDLDRLDYKFTWRTRTQKEETEKRKTEFKSISLPSEFEPLWEKAKERVHKKALKYVLERGVTKQQIEDHFIGFCAVGKYGGRIVIPVYRKERVIGFVSRAFIRGLEPKYLNSDGLKYLWNAPDEKEKRGVLCEGIFDALAAERAIPKVRAMAGLGKDLTDAQIVPLTLFRELTIVPDPDAVGLKGVPKRAKAVHEIKSRVKIYVVMPDKKDSRDWGKLGETSKGEKRIAKAYSRRVQWNKELGTRLRMRAAFL